MKRSLLEMVEDKVIAFGEVIIRSAKGKTHSTVIITIPQEVFSACNLKIGEKMDVLTDGKKIVIKRTERRL